MKGTALILSIGDANPEENPTTTRYPFAGVLGLHAWYSLHSYRLYLLRSFYTRKRYRHHCYELQAVGAFFPNRTFLLDFNHLVYIPTHRL